jgi:hypothetical protein
MHRWARLDQVNSNVIVGEIVDYDPKSIINEQLWDRFVPCDNNITFGYYYNVGTEEFYIPEGYGKYSSNDSKLSPIPVGYIIDENYIITPDPNYIIPKSITELEFRSKLTLSEKLLWDNPDTGTAQQKAAINTMKLDFPFVSVVDIQDELDLLENVGIIGTGRSAAIASQLTN